MRLPALTGFGQSNDSIMSAARSLALLSGLCFPTFNHLSASELGDDQVAQSTQKSEGKTPAPSTKAERAVLIETLKAVLAGSSSQADDPKMESALRDAISKYCDAIVSAEDFSCVEFDAASSFAILHLNIITTRNIMPEETANKFIVEDVLKLHCTLIDKLHSKYPVPGLTPAEIEQRTYALFEDLMWCKNYNESDIFSGACNKLCQRIIPPGCPDLAGRIEYLACKISEHPQLRTNSALEARTAEIFRETAAKYPSHADNLPTISRLFELVLPSEQLVFEFRSTISNHGTQPEAANFYLDLVGPALGEAFAHQMKSEIDGKLASLNIGPDQLPPTISSQIINAALSLTSPKELAGNSKLSAAQLLVRDVLEQSLKGSNWQSLITASDERPTWGELKKRESLRANCVALSLGILNGFDRAIDPDDFTPVVDNPETEISTPELVKNAWRITLHGARQEIRTRLNDLLTLQLSDEDRARLVVNLMVSDSRCYETLVKSDPFQAQTLSEIAEYFPDAVAGNRAGRYSSQVGGVKYVPAALVEGSPAPYADAYYYIRDALVSNRTGKTWSELQAPDSEANELALKYARAHQTVFICEVAKLRWGAEKGLSDGHKHRDLLPILNKFGAFRDNVDLIFDPRLNEPATFMEAIEDHQVEAKRQCIQFHATLKKKFGQPATK